MQASMASPNLLRLFMGLLFLMLVTILFADGFALRTSSGNASVLKRKQQPVYEKAKMVPAMSFVSISEKDRVLKDLEPKALWGYFEDLSQIPRPSKHEEKVLQYLKDFAESHGLLWAQDKIGNLVIKRQGINGGENANPVIIQNHVDMVTEQNAGTAHDFRRDPLRLAVERRPSPSPSGLEGGEEEEWVTALGTTLGADNGIGAAAALALLALGEEEGRPLPPLEALFTVDEETGLTGAYALDPGALGLRGRTLLNLDTEEWGALYVGCAGGGESCITVPPGEREPLEEDELIFELRVDGLMGGHSGINIHEGRANAIRILTGVLDAVSEEGYTLRLAALGGGDKHNAIPREAWARVALLEDEVQEVAAVVRQASKRALKAHKVETAGRVTLLPLEGAREGEEEGGALTVEETDLLVALLNDLPLGVLAMSKDLEGLVETSNNLASVKPSPKVAGGLEVLCSTRSSDPTQLEDVRARIRSVALLGGASEVAQPGAYPGWRPNLGSAVLGLARECAAELLGRRPEVLAIHAGLECGILGEKLPGLDMVSLGPTITGAHSPDEAVAVATVGPFWDLVLAVLARLALPPPPPGAAAAAAEAPARGD